MIHVKICGITCEADAQLAAGAGADALGLVFADSPRRVTPEVAGSIGRELPRTPLRVGVFVNPTANELRRTITLAALDVVQLHGEESPAFCASVDARVWKRIPVRDGDTREALAHRGSEFAVEALLVDPGRGAGRAFRWESARDIGRRFLVAGGLTAANVGAAIRAARPWGVDVSSGVERVPGRKDESLMRAFVAAVRREEQGHAT